MSEHAHETYEEIWSKVHRLVDRLTERLSKEDDEEVRQKLTSEFRFWRRYSVSDRNMSKEIFR